MNKEENKYILYRHIRPDKDEVFYVGLGKKKSRAYCKVGRNDIWKKIVAKNNGNYEVEIMLEDLSFEEAKLKEIEFIKLYERIDLGIGTLANLTDGGEGSLGYKPTKETREKQSKALKGHIVTLESREKSRKSQLGKPKNTEEFKKYLSKINSGENHPQFGKTKSEETKNKIAEKLKGKQLSKEHKEKLSKAKLGKPGNWLGKKRSLETIEKMRVAGKNKIFTEEIRNKIKEGIKNSLNKNGDKVINIDTQEIFESIQDASNKLGYKYMCLYKQLKGLNKNKTNLKLI